MTHTRTHTHARTHTDTHTHTHTHTHRRTRTSAMAVSIASSIVTSPATVGTTAKLPFVVPLTRGNIAEYVTVDPSFAGVGKAVVDGTTTSGAQYGSALATGRSITMARPTTLSLPNTLSSARRWWRKRAVSSAALLPSFEVVWHHHAAGSGAVADLLPPPHDNPVSCAYSAPALALVPPLRARDTSVLLALKTAPSRAHRHTGSPAADVAAYGGYRETYH
jgi:hypothetical protein